MLQGKRVLLIISGGIAAYKSLEIIRRLSERGASVRAIVTRAGQLFVTPLSVASLTKERVFTNLFSLTDEAEIGHIELSRSADIILVAPATADIMAKMAAGIADDLATTTLLATDKPVMIAPAMNVRMWMHPATQRNLEALRNNNIAVVGPNEGDMACGEFGPGRMAEPEEVVSAIEGMLGQTVQKSLVGRKVLITAGPTYEAIDPIRYIANRSSGRQGYAMAAAAAERGADAVLISGPTNIQKPAGVRVIAVETADEMLSAAETELPADIAIFAAAVADWKVSNTSDQKIKKSAAAPALTFAENPDVLSTIAHLEAQRPKLVVGFAAETENVVANAKAKLKSKGADFIIANNVGAGSAVMGGDTNQVHVISALGIDSWPELSKRDVAGRLMDLFAASLGQARKAAE